MSAPSCLNCGKRLARKTETVEFWLSDETAPRTLEECRQRTNKTVVSVRYWRAGKVRHFSTWDGQSYTSSYGYFCKNDCAARFGQKMAMKGARP